MTVERTRLGTRVVVIIIGLSGAVLFAGGIRLLLLGGSPYYATSGLLLIASATYLFKRNWLGIWTYGLFLAATAAWTVWETGLDAWAMLPRLGFPALLGGLLLLPPNLRTLRSGPAGTPWQRRIAIGAVTASILGAPAAALISANLSARTEGHLDPISGLMTMRGESADVDWENYGGTAAGTRFSALEQIRPENIDRLEVAWKYHFGDPHPHALEVTPLKIGAYVYACDSMDRVVALDADTGVEKWRFDPRIDPGSAPTPSCRGVAFYRVPGASGLCSARIYTNTVDARLFALDALSGKPCPGFGVAGQVSLLDGLGKVLPGYYSYNGAPTIARGRIILGASIVDNQMRSEPSGVIRAFDAVSGRLVWAYDVGHPERTGLPPPGEFYTRGTPNSWGQMAYDDALGLVYVPTGNAPPDYFGGYRRSFDRESSSAVMALDVETGRRRWLFQTVHNDLWDFDLGAQPVLFDLSAVKALLQPTKSGQMFLLNRENGRPLARVRERPVPIDGAAPGERLSATQPFSIGMPSLIGMPLTEKSMWGLTPFDQLWCRIRFRDARYEGPLTPPGLTPSLSYPGYLGGMDWGSASIDIYRGVALTVSSHVANIVRLVTRKEANSAHAYPMGLGRNGIDALIGINAQAGTPYGIETAPFLSPLHVPCQEPPWSRLNAIDLRRRKLIWSRPLGTGKDNGPWGVASRLPVTIGTPALGGVLVTAAGVAFVGASTDRTMRAFSVRTGALLWERPLPKSGNATPMTYLLINR